MWLKIPMVATLALIAFCIGLLYRDRSEPLLYRYQNKAAVEHESFIIQNPFRDRGPENAAEELLEQLKEHQCHQALSLRDLDAERTDYLCEREERYQIVDWSTIDRRDEYGHVHLIYSSSRMAGSGEGMPIDIDVEELGNKWIAVKYDTFY